MYTALIIDDETDARSVIRRSLQLFCPQFIHIREARDRAEALHQLKDGTVDMTFLDIRLKKENGIDLYPEFVKLCKNIVFVTAYDEYAVKAFKTEALHYILKPIDPEDLEKAVRRAQLTPSRIVIANLNSRTPLTHNQILYLNSDGPYVHFFTTDGRTITGTHGLKHYDDRLNSEAFCRPHQSYLINLTHVERVCLEEEQYGVVYLRGVAKPIAMSKRRRPDFMRALEQLG